MSKNLHMKTNSVGFPTRSEIMTKIKSISHLEKQFFDKPETQQDIFLQICSGEIPFPITYDPFFKFVFDVERNPERLAEFLSAIMGCRVSIKQVLPHEHHVINELGRMIIMDIVVQLEDGSTVNVEIQKNPYEFLGERASCYSSDLVMREYQNLNEENKGTGRKFSYKDMHPVYTIVILERSPAIFHNFPDNYIHKGKCVFHTGLSLNMLQHYIYIPLDIFREKTHNKSSIDNDLEAWLTLLCENDEDRILTLLSTYPTLAGIYEEISRLRHNIEEAFTMFSEALATLDRNTQEYMVDQMRKEIEEKDVLIEVVKKEIEEKESLMKEQDVLIEAVKKENQSLKKEKEEKDALIAELQTRISAMNNKD